MGRVRNRVAAVMTTVALVASAGIAFGASPAAATPKGTDTVTASAAPGSTLAPHSHYYRLTASPGASVTQTVYVINKNKHAVDVRIAGLDGYTSDATGARVHDPRPDRETRRDLGCRGHAGAHVAAGRSA